MTQTIRRHDWTFPQDLQILFIYLYGLENTEYSIIEDYAATISDEFTVSEVVKKVQARVDEFKGLGGDSTRYTNCCKQTDFVFKEYRDLSMEGLKKIAFNYKMKIRG